MIFIAGATGFVGTNLLRVLHQRGIKTRCLVRSEKKAENIKNLATEIVYGDITDRESLKKTLGGIDTVVHLVGIIRETPQVTFQKVHVEGTENLVEEAKASDVKRFFYQSALGASLEAPFKYSSTKAEAEEIVKTSGLQYVIFRPSLIIGKGDGFTENIKRLLSLGPFVPVPGGGRAKFQPIFIEDWIRCFMYVLDNENLWNRIYEFGGPEHLSYREILKLYMSAIGSKKYLISTPMLCAKVALPLSFLTKAIGRIPPEVSTEQLDMLQVDNITAPDSVERLFGFKPKRLEEFLKNIL
jgi:NADH dehydrogenase